MMTISQISTGFLAGASDSLKALLDDLAQVQRLAAGEVLIQQGNLGDTLLVVMSGSFEVSVLASDGRKLALSMVHPGEVLGEIALFDPGERTATVIAKEQSSVWAIKHEDLMKALVSCPEMSADLLRLAGQRMRWMGRQLSEQVFLPLPARLAQKLLHLTNHTETKQPVLALSQLQLAEFTGSSREAVSKTLSGWNNFGYILLKRGSLQVLDREALKEIANFTLF